MGGKRKTKPFSEAPDGMAMPPREAVDRKMIKWEEREAFAQWLMTPPDEREPKTQKALAIELGVTPESLSGWKRDKRLQMLVYRAAGRHIKVEWWQPILLRQYDIATGGAHNASSSTAAAKFLRDVMEKTIDLDEAIEDAQKPLESMTLDELRAELADVVDLIDDKIDLQL